jgi:ribosomal protein S21
LHASKARNIANIKKYEKYEGSTTLAKKEQDRRMRRGNKIEQDLSDVIVLRERSETAQKHL